MADTTWTNRRIIVAGGTAGFGLVLVRHLLRAGGRVLMVGRSSDGVRQALAACEQSGAASAAVHGIAAELGRAGEGNRVAGEAVRLLGGIDDLFFCVGRSGRSALLGASTAVLQDYLDANLLSAVEITQAVADDVAAARGHLVYIGSLAGKISMPFMGPYSVAKSALAAYADGVRLELEPRGASVLLVSPGPIRRAADDPAADRAAERYAAEARAAGLPPEAAVPGGTTSLAPLDPDRLAGQVLAAAARQTAELVVPRKVSLLAGVIEWFPDAGRRLLARATRRHRRPGAGFTLVELLVTIAIVGALVGLLIPATQAAREAARRASCQSNQRQIGIGFHNHETARRYFPTMVSISGGALHYWVAQILPYLDHNPLASLYDYTVSFSHLNNRSAVQYPLSFMSCPSTPGGPLPDPQFKTGTPAWESVAADYAGSSGPSPTQWNVPSRISYPKPAAIDGFFAPAITIKSAGGTGRQAKHITDGTSKSAMVFECAGRPQVWYFGRIVPDSGLLSSKASKKTYVPNASWAKSNTYLVQGYGLDLAKANPTDQFIDPGPQMINGCNFYSIYSFHPAAAGLLFADGSCRFFTEDTSADVVAAVLTIAGADTPPSP